MKLSYALLAATLSITGCEKKPDAAPTPGAATAAATTATTATTAAPGTPAAAAAGAAGKGAPGTAAGAAVAPSPGGTVIAANNNGKVLVNDAGTVTAKRSDGDTVTKDKNGVTNANGVVVDPKKGTVSVPGVGTFATPPGAQ
jgi:hypothetical protein